MRALGRLPVYPSGANGRDPTEPRAHYPRLARLTSLKDRYDPNSVFRLNAGIPPSSWASGRERR
ncbi:BBE domain-containing protein [Streptomyces sp. NPDC048338]|uniref:BBE domain-containing protein n=1 Tax=Streptomyces sp. NPDC048338 TaxID=3365536 RepID=UPI0037202C7D